MVQIINSGVLINLVGLLFISSNTVPSSSAMVCGNFLGLDITSLTTRSYYVVTDGCHVFSISVHLGLN